MIAGMTYYQICTYFVIYSFAGWVIEVIFHAVTLGKVVNRGFLNGPVCPVYGFGILAVFAVSSLIPQGAGEEIGVLYLFLGGMLLATAVEFAAGFLLDVFFHARWWDYSDKPFNLHGYICLEYSIIWGLSVVFAVKVVHPLISRASVEAIPENIGWWILLAIYILYFTDLGVTIAEIRGLNETLAEVDKVRKSIRTVSDTMTEKIASNAIRTAQVIGEGQVQGALAKAELTDKMDELKGRISRTRLHDITRILRAFPDMKHHQYGETLEYLKNKLLRRSNEEESD
jgi:uncharacterized membrane protein